MSVISDAPGAPAGGVGCRQRLPQESPCEEEVQDESPAQLPPGPLNDFLWTSAPQPHSVRRRAILKKYPEIEELYGSDPSQAIVTVFTIAAQFALCYYVSIAALPPWAYVAFTFLVSGTLNHSLFAAMHEGSHRTVFERKLPSELFCIATTLPMGLPAAIPFKRYHLDHHIYMGIEGVDPDLPTIFEGWFFQATWRKLLWVVLLPATYSLRPMLTIPKEVVPMDVVNWILNFVVDVSVAYFWGWKALGYLLLGTAFSMNFHPFAGHFISEHFIFPDSDIYQETNSYYGIWNLLTYNVGYHNEHHDFPRVPGSRLPLVTRIAKDFYQMPHHHGWMRIMWAFILTPGMTPFNRVKRTAIRGGPVSKEHQCMQLHRRQFPYGGDKRFWPKIDT